MQNFYISAVILFFLSLSQNLTAQEESRAVKNRKEQLERQEEEKKRLGEKAHEEGIQRHRDIQTKETRKRMKENAKRARRNNNHQKEFFLKRWFSYQYPEENFFLQKESYVVNCSVKPKNNWIE